MKRWTNMLYVAMAGILTVGVVAGCSDYRRSSNPHPPTVQNPKLDLESEANVTLASFRETDATIERFINNSYGYAVIPEVKKGGVGIGAARGHGVVYEQGRIIGYTTMVQGSLGAQLGGQVYSQVIFFEDALTLDRFKQGNLQLSARASAVAASHGAAADADYEDGVAVFTKEISGLMFEAAVGGQRFSFEPRTESAH